MDTQFLLSVLITPLCIRVFRDILGTGYGLKLKAHLTLVNPLSNDGRGLVVWSLAEPATV